MELAWRLSPCDSRFVAYDLYVDDTNVSMELFLKDIFQISALSSFHLGQPTWFPEPAERFTLCQTTSKAEHLSPNISSDASKHFTLSLSCVGITSVYRKETFLNIHRPKYNNNNIRFAKCLFAFVNYCLWKHEMFPYCFILWNQGWGLLKLRSLISP